jgi:excinuclease UvrABC helicase subunit UvrB
VVLKAAEPRDRYAQESDAADGRDRRVMVENLHRDMVEAASKLEFEKAARLRDRIAELEGKAPQA